MEDDKFYLEFENTYRGKREDIKARLKIYLPFITPLFQVYPQSVAIDLGCGRGEWLEFLRECDIPGIGVDSNKLMVDFCQKLDLKVEYGDALSFLKAQKDESVAMVSGFHIVEHLPFNVLQEMIKEILRTLKPGGLLIFETPNTENIKVGTVNFYFDPTHLNPVPSQLLSFIVEYAGFYRVKILRLQEPEGIRTKCEINLSDVFSGVSPDYAIVAQKYADNEVTAMIDDLFNKEFGVDLDKLIHKYDLGVEVSQQQLMNKIDNVNSGIVLLNEKIDVFASENESLRQERDELRKTLSSESEFLRQERDKFQKELHEVVNSKSWRVTKPVRKIMCFFRDLIKGKAKFFFRSVLIALVNGIKHIPLSRRIKNYLKSRFPQRWDKIKNKINGQLGIKDGDGPNQSNNLVDELITYTLFDLSEEDYHYFCDLFLNTNKE